MKPERIEILGVPVDCLTMNQALEHVDSVLMSGTAHSVVAVNPEKVMKALDDKRLLERLGRASVLIPDGIGVVFAARILGLGRFERVPGSELMPKLCELAARKGYRTFLFGAAVDVLASAVETLRQRYPGIIIAGSQHGFVADEDMPGLIERINSLEVDILFVALGSPKQEDWIDRYLPLLRVRLCQGVGGTFDVIAGRVKRAPAAFRAAHLEWFYRLATNPQRIRRQTALPKFVFEVLKQRAKHNFILFGHRTTPKSQPTQRPHS
ncbi:Glycosyltransferase, WecB/TagA/CpsF family [Nitrospira sp. KM1]|uniref:WecB/TagA/CpsF family glycosyltransferase n=1 Tax=Nitrospira sp. KM1 TaxID=1936990 RepID=UPI0013A72FFC|nr:WecB/TagA/CpsF family glycosyltransferase [Nitrospira sp. KM1]BCA57130.1 Glycosyltransferase, WecB/TagA/CpsF family [Nitrospira sp. KM1]